MAYTYTFQIKLGKNMNIQIPLYKHLSHFATRIGISKYHFTNFYLILLQEEEYQMSLYEPLSHCTNLEILINTAQHLIFGL